MGRGRRRDPVRAGTAGSRRRRRGRVRHGRILLASPAPYRSPSRCGRCLYRCRVAAAAAYPAGWRPRVTAHVGLLVASFGLAAPPLSLGLAQRSWLWVAIGSWRRGGAGRRLGVRGDAARGRVRSDRASATAAGAGVGTGRGRGPDPGRRSSRLGLVPLRGQPFRSHDQSRRLRGAPAVARRRPPGGCGLVVVAVGASFWARPGRRGWPEAALVTGLLVAAGRG